MNRETPFAFLFALFLCGFASLQTSTSNAATSLFDLGETSGAVQSGWVEVDAQFANGGGSPVSQTDPGTGYTIDVLVGSNPNGLIGRTRTLDKAAAAVTLDDVYSDFIIRVGGIELSNLMENTPYDVEFIMYDDDEPDEVVTQTVTNTTGGGSSVVGQLSWDVTTTLPDDSAQRLLAASVVSDGTGNLTFALTGVGNGGNVLVNGVTVTQVPEPTSIAMCGIAMLVGGCRLRRRQS